MEMTAAIKALEAVPQELPIVIHSDSQYVIKDATEWLRGWKARDWRKADGKTVMNQDLWMQMDALIAGREMNWIWMKDHAGHPENERVDGLANGEARKVVGWSRPLPEVLVTVQSPRGVIVTDPLATPTENPGHG